MKGSRKGSPPTAFTDWLGKANEHWQPDYASMGAAIKLSLTYNLWHEQRGLCVYCGNSIPSNYRLGSDCHIEHYIPQSASAADSLNYGNLFLSCGPDAKQSLGHQTCGHYKGNWYDPDLMVDPVYPDCLAEMKFSSDGQITGLSAKSEETIARVNLNHRELVRTRKNLFAAIDRDEVRLEDLQDNSLICVGFAHAAYHREHLTLK